MAGIPVAQQVNGETLKRLRSYCNKVCPEQFFVLGDLFHSRQGMVTEIEIAWSIFLEEVDAKVTLIVGNHDRIALKSVFNMNYIIQFL
ncbi:metallophosphoesterase [Leptothoe sp. LEGE 181152]|nr:metallophosphoesterase [Adonisia turfae]MDV3351230.1 metallophosphoesterase [Leptothoe sp. LEGE 181152]